MNLKDKYNINSILKNETLFFDILEEDIINYADFLTLINKEVGLAALDIEDFKSCIVGRNTVDFRVHAGDNLTSVTTEILEFIPTGTHVICVITTNELADNPEEIEACNDLIKEKSKAEYFYWNVYITEQKEKYKIYVLVADYFE
ncbi:MAG: hypothetical protein IKJ93_05705 [Clostridia bacterium]|nr:hypothetical protein [Clostridia bacterium]